MSEIVEYGQHWRREILACPLPRIGSKEWGWTKKEHWWQSAHAKYHVEIIGGRYSVGGNTGNYRTEAMLIVELPTAIRIAELLARRDWRRENGRKT